MFWFDLIYFYLFICYFKYLSFNYLIIYLLYTYLSSVSRVLSSWGSSTPGTLPTWSVGSLLWGSPWSGWLGDPVLQPWFWCERRSALIWAVRCGDGICGHWWAGSWCGLIPKIMFPHLSVKLDVDVYLQIFLSPALFLDRRLDRRYSDGQ